MNIDYNKPDFEISISVPRTAEIPVGVSKQYVDDADTKTLSTAQQYADELAERTLELADNSIKEEKTAREQADNEINKEINTLSQGLMDAESEINERITAEETARTTADQAHEEQITAIQARFDDYTTHTEQASTRQELEAQIEEKADKTIIATLATKTEVAEKADKSALDDLATKAEVNAKADASALNALQTVVDGKQDKMRSERVNANVIEITPATADVVAREATGSVRFEMSGAFEETKVVTVVVMNRTGGGIEVNSAMSYRDYEVTGGERVTIGAGESVEVSVMVVPMVKQIRVIVL